MRAKPDVVLIVLVGAQGLVLVEDLSAEQVEALAGGPVLQAEVLAAGGPVPAQQASPKALARTTQRLVAALQHVRPCPPWSQNPDTPTSRMHHHTLRDIHM